MERQRDARRIDRPVRVIGFVLGLCIAAGVVADSMIPAGAGVLGADVHVLAAPTGELAVKPTGMVLEATGLTPGSSPATGDLRVLNQTGTVLDVRLRGIPDTRDLDRALWISLTGPDGEDLYRGPLGGFRRWTKQYVSIRPGDWSAFHLETWVPSNAGPGYAGRIAQVDLGFEVHPEVAP